MREIYENNNYENSKNNYIISSIDTTNSIDNIFNKIRQWNISENK